MTTSTHGAAPGRAAAPPAVPSPPAWRAWVPPAVLAVVVGMLLLATPPFAGDVGPFGSTVGVTFWPVAAACSVAAVVLGRRWPGWATVLAGLPFLATPWLGVFVWGWLLALVAVAVVAALDGVRRAVVPFVALTLVLVVFAASDLPAMLPIGPVTAGTGPGFQSMTLVLYLLLIGAAVGVAAAVGASSRARERQAWAQVRERHALEVEAVAGERARLARDLHDVVAHHVSLVVVRAESAPFQYPALDDRAREVLAAVAADAREALGELRQVLAVLQRADEASPDTGPTRTPQPGADDVERLVGEARDAGQAVVVTGAWGAVPPAPGYVLYRAVQEGLTNARRHAPGRPVRLELRRDGGDGAAERVGFRLANAVDDDVATGPLAHAEPGRGLIGMRERVDALGGRVTTGVRQGEFVLDVALPLGPPPMPLAPGDPLHRGVGSLHRGADPLHREPGSLPGEAGA